MIYSINFYDMTEKLSPIAVCRYLEQTGWILFPFKREGVKVYQFSKEDYFRQVTVPMEKEFSDYKKVMYDVVENLADVECKSIEQVMLYLLNPNTDILKIRLDKKDIETGNILFDDAIQLFDNAKKLLGATALDIVNPRKIHYGRIDESVLKFLNQCRFGQTEIGSYVVSVVCPFAELSNLNEYRQLSIFTDEQRCAQSLTRKVTNRLMDNIATIKKYIDDGKESELASEDLGISSNFLEALNGLNLQSENTLVEFTTQWSPMAKTNRSIHNNIKITNDYYQPIATVIDSIKGKTDKYEEIIGRIKKLSAEVSVHDRIEGVVTVVFLSKENTKKLIDIRLSKEDYENALEAHKYGKVVKAIGEITGNNRRLKMENAVFSVIE